MTGRIGLLGLGEAGAAIGSGLVEAGAGRVLAFDAAITDPAHGPQVRQRADDSGVTLVHSPAEVAADATVILSLVTGPVAKAAAESIGPYLGEHQVYADLNSASPRLMHEVAATLASSGVAFADGAIMAAVPPHGHRVPVLTSGSGAERMVEVCNPYGMRVEAIGDQPGQASAVKLCRSLLVKGIEALLWDAAAAAEAYGAGSRVFSSLAGTLPGDWTDFAGYLMSRTVRHGDRRAHEMDDAAEMLGDLGMDPRLPAAAADRLRAIASLRLAERFEGAIPTSHPELVRALAEVAS